jgi:hypothetical protein
LVNKLNLPSIKNYQFNKILEVQTINLYLKYKIINHKAKQLHQSKVQEKAEEKVLKLTVVPYRAN